MNRKARRAIQKQMGKSTSDDLAEKMFQFDKLPISCSACQKGFDKTDKSMILSWNVVVRQDVVRLFCPECTQKTKEILDEYRQADEQGATEDNQG